MVRLFLYIFSIFSFNILSLTAQNTYPINYFSSPVNYEITLAGNFGEIRPDHFHAGIDIKTDGKEGIPVYASADGYISRINISPYGYGKAIYIDHPNGYTTVYAHLKVFNKTLDSVTKSFQYTNESFELDTLLTPIYYVKKGELIGYSGNTGGSQGPHLHFEIRDTKSEMPINPLFFGLQVKDKIAPEITSVYIYPLSKTASINGENKIKKMKALEDPEYYHLDKSDTLTLNGDIGFGIECFDTENDSKDKNAVFSIELQSGGRRIYYVEFDKFSFEDSRYVNTHIDYAEKENNKLKVQKCYVSKNNKLGIYKELRNNGVITFNDNADHWMRIILKDYAGNSSLVVFKVKGTNAETIKDTAETDPSIIHFNCMDENKYEEKGIKINLPNCSLYDDISFKISESNQTIGYYSPIYHIHQEETALHKSYILSIEPKLLPASLQNKATIVTINKKGKARNIGGDYSEGWVISDCRTFGDLAITIDTAAPLIKPTFKISQSKPVDFTTAKEIRLKAYDNLTGISKYRATVDGKWILCEYDAKTDSFYYTFDEHVQSGSHTFKVEMSDKKNNLSVLEFSFVR